MVALSTTTQPSGLAGRGAASHRARRSLVGFLFAVPALVLFLLFAIYPGVQVFGLSLFDYSLTSAPEFVGFDNFVFLSTDPRFGEALLQTVFYAAGTYLPALALALILAQALSTRIRGMGLVRLLYFLPLAMSWVAVSIIWRVVLHPERDAQRGPQPRRQLAHEFRDRPLGAGHHEHLEGDRLLPDPVPRRPVGHPDRRLRGRPPRRCRSLGPVLVHDVPAAAPVTAVCRDHGGPCAACQSFSPQAVLTNGAFGTEVVNLFVYKTAFESARMGRASAVAVLIFVILLGLALVQLRALRRKD